jgi:hypothetical protein
MPFHACFFPVVYNTNIVALQSSDMVIVLVEFDICPEVLCDSSLFRVLLCGCKLGIGL